MNRNTREVGPLVVLLRGAPGVGKSSAASRLASEGIVGAVIEVDAMRRFIVGINWRDRSQHDAAIAAGARAAAEFAIAGVSPVLLVDCFGRGKAQGALELVRAAGVEATVVSLWAAPDTVRSRLDKRTGNYGDVDIALLINAEMGADEDEPIDTTALTAHQVAELVRGRIEGVS